MSLDLLKGTLDVLILKTLEGGPQHGYAVSKAIREQSSDQFQLAEGALYPALRRLQRQGLLSAEWATSDTGRDVRVYELTAGGKERLEEELRTWEAYVEAMSRVLQPNQAAG